MLPLDSRPLIFVQHQLGNRQFTAMPPKKRTQAAVHKLQGQTARAAPLHVNGKQEPKGRRQVGPKGIEGRCAAAAVPRPVGNSGDSQFEF